MNRIVPYVWATTASLGAGTMGYKSHRLALQSYPPIQTWNRMTLVEKSAEYVRHGVIIGSGITLGVAMPIMFFLSSV